MCDVGLFGQPEPISPWAAQGSAFAAASFAARVASVAPFGCRFCSTAFSLSICVRVLSQLPRHVGPGRG